MVKQLTSRKRPVHVLVIALVTVAVYLMVKYRIIVPKTTDDINYERVQHLRDMCDALDYGEQRSLRTTYYFYSEPYNLLYCSVFKSGSTSWFYYFNVWSGRKDREVRRNDNPLSLARTRYPEMNLTVLMNKMKTSHSFIVVRDPFLRLISAYEDKMLDLKHWWYGPYAKKIYIKYHGNHTGTEVPSFQDLVHFILDEIKDDHPFNIHWEPISQLCTPCFARYDTIMKLETYQEDHASFLQRTKLKGIVKPDRLNRKRTSSDDQLIEKYFANLPDDMFDALCKIYREDFQLFGYSLDRYHEIRHRAKSTAIIQ